MVFIKSVVSRKINLKKKIKYYLNKIRSITLLKVNILTSKLYYNIYIRVHTYLTTVRSRNQVNVFIASHVGKPIPNAHYGLDTVFLWLKVVKYLMNKIIYMLTFWLKGTRVVEPLEDALWSNKNISKISKHSSYLCHFKLNVFKNIKILTIS